MNTDAKVLGIIADLNQSECEEILAEYDMTPQGNHDLTDLRNIIKAYYSRDLIYGNDIVSTWGPSQ